MPYNKGRKGFETKDKGLIRINGEDNVRTENCKNFKIKQVIYVENK